MKNFILMGAAGYIAPRHMKAIKDTGNNLLAICDPSDSVGIIDSYFPNCLYFREFERFDRYCSKKSTPKIDYTVICSPNYLHDSHCRFGLRLGSNVICEKPLVINPNNLAELEEIEKECAGNIYTILQLRLHPTIKKIKDSIDKNKCYDVSLAYITPRGPWYERSWKGDYNKSGGILYNIGIHFFDMLLWMFGDINHYNIEYIKKNKAKGVLYLNNKKTTINWFMSTDINDSPNRSFFRKLVINDEELRFDNIQGDLHVESYKDILSGNGFRMADVKNVITLVSEIKKWKS